jgi:hypothetical protein
MDIHEHTTDPPDCPDCGTPTGQYHKPDCDVERCLTCGKQRLTCGCESAYAIWTGDWPETLQDGKTQPRWKVVGSPPELHIYEVREGGELIYDEAKACAIALLQRQVEPLLKRIEEIEAGVDLEAGKVPELKLWQLHGNGFRELVCAKTKKRARELTGFSRHEFDNHYTLVDAVGFYQYARVEGVWEWCKHTEQFRLKPEPTPITVEPHRSYRHIPGPVNRTPVPPPEPHPPSRYRMFTARTTPADAQQRT